MFLNVSPSVSFTDVVFVGDYSVTVMVLLVLLLFMAIIIHFTFVVLENLLYFPLYFFLQVCPLFLISIVTMKSQIISYFCLSTLSIHCHSIPTLQRNRRCCAFGAEKAVRMFHLTMCSTCVKEGFANIFMGVCLLEIIFLLRSRRHY